MHLWFLVHGLYGDVSNFEVMHQALESAVPKGDHVYIAASNQRFYTFDGIEIGGLRVFDELMHVIEVSPEPVTHISIVGYSLGGLYTRYLIGLLEENGVFEKIKPVVYTTFASPHLGSTQWTPKYTNRLLNGIGRVFVGVSGAQLMCRWNWGLLQAMSEPGSKYYTGLKRFSRRILFANAINDRSVHFWTAFLTNKVPFAKGHDRKTELAFYSYDGDPQGRFILDLERSRHITGNEDSDEPGRSLVLNLGIPIMLTILFFVSMRSFICYPFLLAKWRFKYGRLRARLPISRQSGPTQENVFSEPPTRNIDESTDAESPMEMVLDRLPPKDEGDDSKSAISKVSTSSPPQPVLNNKAAFIDSATETLPFSKTLLRRMNNVNSVGWEKYVVYIDGWSHAHIINRRNNRNSQGTELLKFFAAEVTKTPLPAASSSG